MGIPTFNTFTLETWACPKEEDGDIEGIVSIYKHAPEPRKGLNLTYLNRDNLFRVQYATEVERSFLNGPTGVTEYKWYHLATTYDGTTLKLYIDGELVNSIDPNGPIVFDDPHDLDIGHWASTYRGYPFKGIVDEVRYWNYARTEQDIKDNMYKRITKAPGLVARYGFDEGSGTIAYDTSGNGYHGTIYGATYTDHTPFPPYGKSILIEEGTENVWTGTNSRTRATLIERYSPYHEVYQLISGNYAHLNVDDILENTGEYATVSYKARVLNGSPIYMISYIRSYDGTVNTYSNDRQEVWVGSEWVTVSQSALIENKPLDRHGWLALNPVDQIIEVKDMQTEYKPYPTSFTVGVRAPESLFIPTDGVLGTEEGQIDIDLTAPSAFPGQEEPLGIFSTANTFNASNLSRSLLVRREPDGRVRCNFGTGGTNRAFSVGLIEPDESTRITVTWSRTEGVKLYQNGVFVGTDPQSQNFYFDWNPFAVLGRRTVNQTTYYSNMSFHGFRIRSRAMTDQEIADEYAQGPLRPDQLTTYFLPFEGNLDTSQMVKRAPRWRGYSGVTM